MSARPVVMWAPIEVVGDSEFILAELLGHTENDAKESYGYVEANDKHDVRFARVTVSEGAPDER